MLMEPLVWVPGTRERDPEECRWEGGCGSLPPQAFVDLELAFLTLCLVKHLALCLDIVDA